jgi:hypothetical protein
VSISSKRHLKAIVTGYFLQNYSIVDEKFKMESFYSWEKKTWSTENNVQPNWDDSGHVLIIPIDVDLRSERTIRCTCIQWPDIKSHKIRSVVSRSRCIMMKLNKLSVHQSELNLLYSLFQINDTKFMRNGRWAHWSSTVWVFKIPKCDGGHCYHYVLGLNDTLGGFWSW